MYDSLLRAKLAQVNSICLANNIAIFVQTDKDVIREFFLVMQPVVASLDRLQSKEDAYIGALLPTL